MRKVLIVDISGKVELYDKTLFHALEENCIGEVKTTLLVPGNGLLRIIPRKYCNSSHIIKRLLKVIEGLLNYFYLLYYLFLNKVDIIHLQWLPFLEVCSLEYYYLKILKRFFPKIKIILTVHNIYPHNFIDSKRERYKKRFKDLSKLIDIFIVHTKASLKELSEEFSILVSSIKVIHHGVFVPNNLPIPNPERKIKNKIKLIQFGGHSFYKGTDLFVKAVAGLSEEDYLLIEPHIEGKINPNMFKDLLEYDKMNRIIWKNYYVPDEELYKDIIESDVIVIPYRAISQSGVLLLALFFEKLIIISDLPSFKETLEGYDSRFFFISNDVNSLKNTIVSLIHNNFDFVLIKDQIKTIKERYSWDFSAKETIELYKSIF